MGLRDRARGRGPAPRLPRRWLDEARFEVLPLDAVLDETAHLPENTTVTVTASPTRGLDATVQLCEKLAAQRLRVVPHLAARQVRDATHLRDVLDRLAAVETDEVFVIAGDASTAAGPFGDGLSLLRAIEESGRRPRRIGVPCYPEGHPTVPDDALWEALRAKQPYADYAVSQLCFDPGVVCRFLRAARQRGVTLPVLVGVAGVVSPAALLRVGSRIGVGDSLSFLRANRSTVAGLVSRHDPGRFLAGLADRAADGECAPAGLHFYTFNRVSATTAWLTAVRGSHTE